MKWTDSKPVMEGVMFVAFCTEGQMTLSDIRKECQAQAWCPLLIYLYEDVKVLPLFSSQKVCRDFLRRNLPKDWICGAVELTKEDFVKLHNEGILGKHFDHPRKLKDVIQFEVHIHEFVNQKPDVFVGRR